ncbi:hypothetical protein FG877_07845 [Enterococcus casseliflavus]|nr:hypothetical protein [Enterococcus casseliflavus]
MKHYWLKKAPIISYILEKSNWIDPASAMAQSWSSWRVTYFPTICNDRLAISQSVFLRSSKKWYTVTETAAQRRQHVSSCAAKNGFHEVKT